MTDEFVYQERYTPSSRATFKLIRYVVSETGCWVCTSHAKANHRGGYPVITRNGKFYRLSRYVYEQENGTIPDGHFVMHTCDNTGCINPEHLVAGTPKENTDDMIIKGRKPIGENVPCAKLTDEIVLKILQDYRPLSAIARSYGVSKKAIQNVKKRKTWKHVKEER